jgi:hypothetical protein
VDDIFSFPKPKLEQHIILDGKVTLYTRAASITPTWHYSFKLPDGTLSRVSTKTTDLKEAMKIAEDRFRVVQWRSQHGISYRLTTLGEALKSYADKLKGEQQREGEKYSRKQALAKLETYLIPGLGHIQLSLLNGKYVSDFLDQYEKNYHDQKTKKFNFVITKDRLGNLLPKPRVQPTLGSKKRPPTKHTRRQFETLLRLVCEHAVKMGLITLAEQPSFDITPMGRFRRGWFDANEQTRLLGRLEARIKEIQHVGHESARRLLWFWVRFHLLTGLRPGEESRDLRFCDIQLQGNAQVYYIVNVRKGKRGARKVLVHQRLGELMKEMRQHHPNPQPNACLWVRGDGVKVEGFNFAFGKVLDELDMRRCDDGLVRSSYSLRHSAISNAIQDRIDITFLAKNMGTSIAQITKTYDHVIHLTQAHMLMGQYPQGK